MNIHWIIEETEFSNDCDAPKRLFYYLQEIGCPVTTFKYIPFGGTDYSFLETEDIKKSQVVYLGSWNALADIRKSWGDLALPTPFAWCDWDVFRCSYYYSPACMGNFIIQTDVKFLKLEELSEKTFGDEDSLFIRPDDNEKSFLGQVVKKELCGGFKKYILGNSWCPPNLDIVVARAKHIINEWRVIIVDGVAVTGSQYRGEGGIEIVAGIPDDVKSLAERAAKHWSPYPVFVIDIAEVEIEEDPRSYIGIVEIGPFNYAGLYRCDLKAIADSVNRFLTTGPTS